MTLAPRGTLGARRTLAVAGPGDGEKGVGVRTFLTPTRVRPPATAARRGRRGLVTAATLAVASSGVLLGLGAAGVVGPTTAAATTLPPCPTLATWPYKPITPVVKATLVYYYRARHLTPLSV